MDDMMNSIYAGDVFESDDAEGEAADRAAYPTGTRLARIMNNNSGAIVWRIAPITLEINDHGQCVDSGPLDAVLDDLAIEFPRVPFVGVWDDSQAIVICAD